MFWKVVHLRAGPCCSCCWSCEIQESWQDTSIVMIEVTRLLRKCCILILSDTEFSNNIYYTSVIQKMYSYGKLCLPLWPPADGAWIFPVHLLRIPNLAKTSSNANHYVMFDWTLALRVQSNNIMMCEWMCVCVYVITQLDERQWTDEFWRCSDVWCLHF